MKFFSIKLKYHFWKKLFSLLNFFNIPLKDPKSTTLVLLYHGVVKENATKYNSRFISKAFFEEFIKYITTHYNVISLDDFYSFLEGSRTEANAAMIIAIRNFVVQSLLPLKFQWLRCYFLYKRSLDAKANSVVESQNSSLKQHHFDFQQKRR